MKPPKIVRGVLGMRTVAVGWVLAVTVGISAFLIAKKDIDRKRLQKMERIAKEEAIKYDDVAEFMENIEQLPSEVL
eukprot:gene17660-19418_t